MKVAQTPADLSVALATARAEAKAAFGDESVYLENNLQQPRHIEIQGAGRRRKGRGIHLVRARLLAAAPAPEGAGGEPLARPHTAARDRIGETVAHAIRELKYLSVGTVEFLYEDGQFFFIEMKHAHPRSSTR